MNGIIRAMPMVALKPGSAPITIPPTTPISSAIRTSKVNSDDAIVGKVLKKPAYHRRASLDQQPGGQIEFELHHEQKIDKDVHAKCDEHERERLAHLQKQHISDHKNCSGYKESEHID